MWGMRNPLPVAVLLLPVDDGVLAIRRAVPPRAGELALPGGFIELGETWQQAAARELYEEAGVRIDPAAVEDERVLSAPDGTLLVFGRGPLLTASSLPPFSPTDETSERVLLRAPTQLAFPLHTLVLDDFFRRR